MDMAERETLGSRLGFLLLAVGCAVGLGNVWRFPYITGRYGGGIFVLLYLFFLLLFGLPLLVMELSVGRAGGANLIGSIRRLSEGRRGWVLPAKIVFTGNLLLMMYYTTVTGWLLAYSRYYLDGSIMNYSSVPEVGGFFNTLISSPGTSAGYMVAGVALSALVCGAGLRRGVENIVKIMMIMLFLLIVILAVYAMTMPGAAAGMRFYLLPDWGRFSRDIGETVFAAMGQAFFTLSIGVGSMAVLGSYTGREHSLAGESVTIIVLDTIIALLAGVIIFSICFSFGVSADSGPGLIFVSLPNIFAAMNGGRWLGLLFFVFLSLAALTTTIAVFENMIAYLIDEWRVRRPAAAVATGLTVAVFSLPCVFGFNLWKNHQPLGKGSSWLDFEDFLVSQNLLPLGALMTVLFCSISCGRGGNILSREANTGRGWRFPSRGAWYFRFVLPLLVVSILVIGYWRLFFAAK